MNEYNNNANSKGKGPMIITFLILAVIIIAALFLITPHDNTPLVTGDQQAQPGTATSVPEAGAGEIGATIQDDSDTSITGESAQDPVAP